MNPTPIPSWKEEDRLKAIASYEILDTPIEKDFEDIAKLASQICEMPISVITFIEKDRQWFKSVVGLDAKETPRSIAICSHAILQPGLFVVPDTTKDARFDDNPLVQGEPHLRFYAGALLETAEGLPLGTICVLDYKPRVLTEYQAFALNALSRQVMTQLELRKALREKQKNEERLTLALEASGSIGTWDWDVVNDRVYADPQFVSIFGGEASWSVEGAPIAEYVKAIHPDDLVQVKAKIEAALEKPSLFDAEYRLLQKDGSVRWLEARGRCRFDAEGKPIRFPGVAVDITERKAVEQRVRDAAERFRFMAESMPQKIFITTPTGEVDFFNHQWMEFTGRAFEEIRNWGWTKIVHPDDVEENLSRWKFSVQNGKAFEMQQRFRRHDGVYRWHLSRANPMRDSEGKVIMWIGSNTDIDDQKQAHENLEKTVVERTARLQASVAELESFSYSISHDMRAPLRAMSGFAQILKEDYGPQLDAEANHYLDRIGTATARMDDLIRDVLSFSQLSRSEVNLQQVDLDELLHEIVESYPNLRASQVDIFIEKKLPSVRANSSALTQCISNLLGNAVKFVAVGTKPQIKIWPERRESRVRIFFQDNGIGIAEHEHAQIFDIFHRADRTFEGTGIGLAIVKKAVERMGGGIGLASELGKGSTFWLDLEAA